MENSFDLRKSTGGVAPSTRFHLNNSDNLNKPQLLPARNLRNNDKVLSRKMMTTTITSKRKTIQYMFRILLENGEFYDVSQHQKLVLTNETNNKFYMTVEDCLKTPNKIFSQYRVSKGTAFWKKQYTLIDPFFMGCWLGSRMCDLSGFCTSRKNYNHVKSWFELFSIEHTSTPSINYINIPDTSKNLTHYNLYYNNKFVPRDYKFNDISNRTNLLRGFFLTSECFRKGYISFLRFENLALAHDIVYVARSLGYKAKIKRNRIILNLIPSTTYKFKILPLGKQECVTLTSFNGRDTILTEDFDEILIE